jgi:hypothetical protein
VSAPLRDFARYLELKLDEEIGMRVYQNGEGAASSWDDYRFRCGRIAGLSDARNYVDEALRNFLDDDQEG